MILVNYLQNVKNLLLLMIREWTIFSQTMKMDWLRDVSLFMTLLMATSAPEDPVVPLLDEDKQK